MDISMRVCLCLCMYAGMDGVSMYACLHAHVDVGMDDYDACLFCMCLCVDIRMEK